MSRGDGDGATVTLRWKWTVLAPTALLMDVRRAEASRGAKMRESER